MDLKHTTTSAAVAAAVATVADSPETEGETPLHSQLIKPLSSLIPNGKPHHHHHPHHHHPPPTVVTYKECLKNHAASIGSHALDGCGEFMPLPNPTHTPQQPTSLKCAACGCHRNFHRRDPIIDFSTTDTTKTHFIELHHHGGSSPPQPTNYAYAPHVLLSLNTAEQTHTVATPGTPAAIKIENPNGRKRFRTKFSQYQKEKMSIFAEKVGWKMQRCDDKLVADFCNEIGIRRGIFKVWMHNNKNTFGKKEKDTTFPTATVSGGGGVTAVGVSKKSVDLYDNGKPVISSESREEDDNVDGGGNSFSDQENGGGDGGGGGGSGRGGGGVHLQASTNGSSSSC